MGALPDQFRPALVKVAAMVESDMMGLTFGFSRKWLLFSGSSVPPAWCIPDTDPMSQTVSESPQPSTSILHEQWVKLENEHHQLAVEIDSVRARGG